MATKTKLWHERAKLYRMFCSEWRKRGLFSESEIEHLAVNLLDIDELAEKIQILLRKDIKLAMKSRDDERLLKALVMFDIRLWELHDQHIRRARRIIDRMTTKLSNEIEKSENLKKPSGNRH